MGFHLTPLLEQKHCIKSVRIRSRSGPHFPTFGLNTERYAISLRIQSECGKIRTRITPNTNTFHAVKSLSLVCKLKTRSKSTLRKLSETSF